MRLTARLDDASEFSNPSCFSREVPKDVAGKILKDFVGNQKLLALKPLPPEKVYLDGQGNPLPQYWMFTVHKQVSRLKLAGLVARSIVIPALIIQGSISVLAWIARDFMADKA